MTYQEYIIWPSIQKDSTILRIFILIAQGKK